MDFKKLSKTFWVADLKNEILNQPDLWNRNTERTYTQASPHSMVSDIWARFNDVTKYRESGDFSTINDEHDSVWYPEAYRLPSLRKIVFDLMHEVDGERLGGVLITKVAPGGKIGRHTDKSWHAKYYSKFYIPIQNEEGARFHFDSGVIKPKEGDAYWFDNSCPHWVENDSGIDRIALIVCIKTDQYYGQKYAL